MNPHQLSNHLRLIASRIDNSVKPSRSRVISDLKSIVSALYQSGDPKNGGYELTIKLLVNKSNDSEKVVSVNGRMNGKVVSGEMTVYLSDGEFDGWDYSPDPNSYNIHEDEEDFQTVLDSAIEEIGLS